MSGQSVVDTWRRLDFSRLQQSLEKDATDIADRQDDSEASRRKLVDQSKAFRQTANEEVRKTVAPVLRSFQAEIDSLAKRSALAETAFLNLFKTLADVPDPTQVLEQAGQWQQKAKELRDAKLEAESLRETLSQYNSELADVKNQEVTIRQLRERVKAFEEQFDGQVETAVSRKETEMRAEWERREAATAEAEASASRRAEAAERRAGALETALAAAQSQLLAVRSRADDTDAAVDGQWQLLARDLERANQRAVLAEQEVELLREKLATVPPAAAVERGGADVEEQLAAKESQVAHLLAEMSRTRDECDRKVAALCGERDALQTSVERQQETMRQIEAKLSAQVDYDELRNELAILKSIEFGDDSASDDSAKSVQVLLVGKNKALMADNTNLKLEKLNLEEPNEAAAESESSVADDAEAAPFDVEAAVAGGMRRQAAESRALAHMSRLVDEGVRRLADAEVNADKTARLCRNLMATHNIGQRLFARTVLNQSQGSLSELLSKPRAWQRLTEKGRQAFRRIHAWVADRRAVQLLTAVSPRKPTAPTASPVGIAETPSPSADEQSRASSAGERVSVAEVDCQPSPPPVANAPPANNRWRHDDIPKEKILDIFNRERAKLLEQEKSLERVIKPSAVVGSARSVATRRSFTLHVEPIREASETLARLEQLSAAPTCADDWAVLGSRPLRTQLPPISQQQYEHFGDLDTDEVVAAVKELLAHHSISQRQFGEFVLGLSQGSVSDLLARPKPWAMLTQKGREPFIRMQMFIEEPRAAERLGRRHSFAPPPSADTAVSAAPSILQSHCSVPGILVTSAAPSAVVAKVVPMCLENGSVAEKSKAKAVSVRGLRAKDDTGHYSYDTVEIARQVKEILHTNGICQKDFGDAVLKVTQGTVSDLLSKPRPWHCLSERGRGPYKTLYEWLRNPRKLDYFPSVSGQRSAVTPAESPPPPDEVPPMSRKRSPSDSGESPSGGAAPKKMQRTVLNAAQRATLLRAYEQSSHPSQRAIELLADEAALTCRTVSNWFANHRARHGPAPSLVAPAAGRPADSSPSPADCERPPSVAPDNPLELLDFGQSFVAMLNHFSVAETPSAVDEPAAEAPIGRRTLSKQSLLDRALDKLKRKAEQHASTAHC